jgi:hypothetical protein
LFRNRAAYALASGSQSINDLQLHGSLRSTARILTRATSNYSRTLQVRKVEAFFPTQISWNHAAPSLKSEWTSGSDLVGRKVQLFAGCICGATLALRKGVPQHTLKVSSSASMFVNMGYNLAFLYTTSPESMSHARRNTDPGVCVLIVFRPDFLPRPSPFAFRAT